MASGAAGGQPGIDLKAFEGVDDARQTQAYIAILDAFDALPGIQTLKHLAIAHCQVQPGQTVFDDGCGAGLETLRLARLVAPTGKVIGLDASRGLLAEAQRRLAGTGLPVEYREGDAEALPFPDKQFDLARAERLFPYLADPTKALAELVRVTRPGGRVYAIEPDFETTTINLDDRHLVRRVLHHDCDHNTRNGWIGRELPDMFKAAGLVNMRVDAGVVIYEPRLFESYFHQIARSAAQASAISADELTRWESTVGQMIARDELFATVSYFLIVGEVPA